MDICVLSRVGGFRLGKLVSILSNENKWMEVAFTQTLCRTLYDVVGNALDTLVTIGSYYGNNLSIKSYVDILYQCRFGNDRVKSLKTGAASSIYSIENPYYRHRT